MLRDESVLLDIAGAAQQIIAFKQGMSKEMFLEDVKTQSAILHQLMVMGEAVKRLSSDFREKHDDIPWGLIAGMRDVLIHVYDAVDLDEVWKTANDNVPELVSKLMPLMPDKPDADA